ncbi:MAG: phospholipase D-like domain-containing protein [Candidatus Aenigmatarchaeota archaeon]
MKKVVVLSSIIVLSFSMIASPLYGLNMEAAEGGVEPQVTNQVSRDVNLKITEVYYNTGPGSEFLTVENWGDEEFYGDVTLSNGEAELQLKEIRLGKKESFVAARDEGYEAVWNETADAVWTNESAVESDGNFTLSDESGKVLLSLNDRTIDSFYYGDGEGGKLWSGEWVERHWKGEYAKRKELNGETVGSDKENWTWERRWMVGHSNFHSEEMTYRGNISGYTAPDSSLRILLDHINDTEETLQVAVYQLESLRIARRIANLSRDGIEVKVLVDGSPVGGISEKEHYALSLIKENEGEIRTIGGERYSPYDFFHCKYIIRDERSVLISSENFVDTGYPLDRKRGNRGWGVVIENEKVAEYYDEVYRSDWYFTEIYKKRTFEEEPEGSDRDDTFYTPKFNGTEFYGKSKVTPLLSPDTSMSPSTILDMIESADHSIYVQQAYINYWSDGKNPYLTALKDAALQGIEVKVLLDSTWYQMEKHGGENDLIVRNLNTFGEEEDISLEARLLSSYKDLLKIHNKGMVVDESRVMVSSINWNANSPLHNREVGVIVENERLAEYYSEVFLTDWEDTIKPIADAGPDRSVTAGSKVNLSGENSWDDHRIVEYRWNLNGDSNYDREGEEITVKFEELGTRRIELYVEDVEGNTDTVSIKVEVVEEQTRMGWRPFINWVVLLAPLTAVVSFLLKKMLWDPNRS